MVWVLSFIAFFVLAIAKFLFIRMFEC